MAGTMPIGQHAVIAIFLLGGGLWVVFFLFEFETPSWRSSPNQKTHTAVATAFRRVASDQLSASSQPRAKSLLTETQSLAAMHPTTATSAGVTKWVSCSQRAWTRHWSLEAGRQFAACPGKQSALQCRQQKQGEELRRVSGSWDTYSKKEPPWFCSASTVSLNFSAIRFDAIDYSLPTWSNMYHLPDGFLQVFCPPNGSSNSSNGEIDTAEGSSCPLAGWNNKLRPASPLKHFLPCGIRLTPRNPTATCRTPPVQHQVAVLVRSAVKNWFHVFFNLVDVFHMLVAAGATETLREIILLPPDKAHAGQFGNQLDILRMMANGGPVRTAENISRILDRDDKDTCCYDDLLILANGQSGMVFMEDTSARDFARVVRRAGCAVAEDATGERVRRLLGNEFFPSLRMFSRRVLSYYGLPLPENNRPPVGELNSGSGRPRVVIITRGKGQGGQYGAKVTHRLILNEDALVETVRKLGLPVQTIDFQQLTLGDQVRLMASTDILIGAHGAGLTNAVFLPATSVVIEAAPKTHVLNMYAELCQRLGLQYTMALADSADHTESFHIDPATLEHLLRRIVKDLST